MSTQTDMHSEAAALEILLVSRSYLYTLFHKLMGAAPNEEILATLLSEETAAVVEEYAEDDATMQGLVRFLATCSACDDQEQLLSDARDEYTRLFVGPGTLPALPWESPYRTHEATLFQENTLVVRSKYGAGGFEPKRMQRVPDDHVALMCAFVAKQAEVSLAALRAGELNVLAQNLREQHMFVSEHMGDWLGEFARQERRSKTAVLYPQMIEALAGFAAVDAVFLSEAAFWAENMSGTQNEGLIGNDVSNSAERKSLLGIEHALEGLVAMRPFGIEDYELVSIKR